MVYRSPMKTRKTPSKLTHHDVKTREPLILALIQGATKAGVAPDRRKQADKRACRAWKRTDLD